MKIYQSNNKNTFYETFLNFLNKRITNESKLLFRAFLKSITQKFLNAVFQNFVLSLIFSQFNKVDEFQI